jgi:serine/threonine-protein kinase
MVTRLAAALVFVACASVVCWQAMVHTVHGGTLAVPDLVGQTVEQAARTAHDVGLQIEVDATGAFAEEVEVGAVAVQQPRPGFHVKTGSTVRVRVSLGSERTAIPDVRGESLQGGVLGLQRVGLVPGERAHVDVMTGADQVIATDPPIGDLSVPGSEIHVLVNQAPATELWIMPSLLYRSSEQVRQLCLSYQLRLGQVHQVPYPGLPSGTVVRQYPPEGSPVSRADIITVWVAQ